MPSAKISAYPFIGLAGNIGVGKTTFARTVSKHQNWTPFYESVSDNPYLADFYLDMKRWSFNLQIYFLHKRFNAHQQMSEKKGGVIQDRTIYEDIEIFARNLYEMGNISKRDWENYRDLFFTMKSFLIKPNLIVYLKASTDTLISRIKGRDREYERALNPEYLHRLNISYDKWISSITDCPVITIQTDNFNIFTDSIALQNIENQIVENI